MTVHDVTVTSPRRSLDQPTSAQLAFDRGGPADIKRLPIAKRCLDVAVGTLALVLLAPVMLIAACLVRLSGRGPVIFRQERVGQGEVIYQLFKFRTMRHLAANPDDERESIVSELRGNAAPDKKTGLFRSSDDERVSPIGKLLRKLSIDELPQLINVLRGEMSLVGPRPALPWQVKLFTPEQRRRHAVVPGITGLWQVSGRNRLTTPQMIELDLRYIDHWSLSLDVSILLRTPRAVLLDRFTG